MENFPSDKAPYPSVLDHKPGFFLSWLLYRLFKRVRFDENMTDTLRNINREGTVVYAIKYRGNLEYLLYHYRFRMQRLPYPKIAFDINMSFILPFSRLVNIIRFHFSHFIRHGKMPRPFENGFYRDAIRNGTTSLVSLIDPVGFKRHFVHSETESLYFLLQTQKEMEKPIYLVPQLVLYSKSPEKESASLLDIFFGYKDKPGFIRKIVLFFRNHRKAFIDFGKPLNLKSYLESQPEDRPMEDLTIEVRQMLIESIDAQKRVILGPIMKTREQFMETTLKDLRINKTIQALSGGNPQKAKKLRKKAEGYFDEIAADYNIAYIKFFHKALSWVWKKLYEDIEVDPAQLATLRDWARKGPVIYIPSHKSHIDYLILNYVLFEYHTHIPRIAAGKNLTFWPMGHVFRKSGAFFIRRTFKGATLYTEVFERYVKALLEEGHPLEFFIEGGRSRSGKLILPKIGFLSILLRAQQEGYCDDLVFVPASISYDRILEEKSILREIGGGDKERENFKQMMKARHFLKRKHGKIYINFATPFSLKEYLEEQGGVSKGIHRQIAFHLIQEINRVTVVTPLALAATAILTRHRRGFFINDLKNTKKILLELIHRQDKPVASTLNNLDQTTLETLSILTNRKVLSFIEDVDGEKTFYYVDDDKKAELEYYKNSIVHCFIPYSFAAVCMLKRKSENKKYKDILDDYDFLKSLFTKEFIYDEGKDNTEELNNAIGYFTERGLITESKRGGAFAIAKSGFDELSMWANLTKTFLESYWVAASSFIQVEKRKIKKADLLKNMTTRGQKYYKMGLIEHAESISQITFKNAIQYFSDNTLRGHSSYEKSIRTTIESLTNTAQRIYEFSHFRPL